MSDSGKADYNENEIHPFPRRVIDHLPAGRLLLAGEATAAHAAYAAEVGWDVHIVGFKAEDQAQLQVLTQQTAQEITFDLYKQGRTLCEGPFFDAAILLNLQLPERLRTDFHQAVINCLKTDGGNLYLLAYSEEQPADSRAPLPDVLYREADLMKDFRSLQIDMMQAEQETLPGSKEEVRLIRLTAVRNQEQDGSDTVSFSLDG